MYHVEAKWTGSWPCLCSGEWVLMINGENVSHKIPDDLRTDNMGTAGDYQRWYFSKDYEEVWETYSSGLDCKAWIEKNRDWLENITTDPILQESIFEAFQVSDWRHGSCGGCI